MLRHGLVGQSLTQWPLAPFVGRAGHPVQQADQTTVDIDEGHAARAFRGEAGAPDQTAQEFEGKFGVIGDVAQQCGPGHNSTGAGLGGFDIGRSGAAVERHFAHVFPRPVRAEGEFLAAVVGQKGPKPALENDVERVAGFPFLYQQRPPAVETRHPEGGQSLNV
ncbi:hypothetical protein D9M68_790670 [compost metagenome]